MSSSANATKHLREPKRLEPNDQKTRTAPTGVRHPDLLLKLRTIVRLGALLEDGTLGLANTFEPSLRASSARQRLDIT